MTESLNLHTFNIFFGSFILFVSVVLMLRDKLKPLPYRRDQGIVRTFTDNAGQTYEYGFSPAAGVFIAFVVGFLSGIFGIGGGSLMVPTMILIFFFPPRCCCGNIHVDDPANIDISSIHVYTW